MPEGNAGIKIRLGEFDIESGRLGIRRRTEEGEAGGEAGLNTLTKADEIRWRESIETIEKDSCPLERGLAQGTGERGIKTESGRGGGHIDPEQNMGMFMDDASHAADWFLWMLGRPVSVMAEIDNIVTDIAPDDNGVALFRFAKREMGLLINSSTMLAAESTTEIYGDKGVLIQNYGDSPASTLPRPPGATALKIFTAGAKDWQPFDFPADTPHGDRIRAVPRQAIDYLQGKRGPIATAEEGKICIEMILAAYESAREGRRVKL